jgi:hypothetical protein
MLDVKPLIQQEHNKNSLIGLMTKNLAREVNKLFEIANQSFGLKLLKSLLAQ